ALLLRILPSGRHGRRAVGGAQLSRNSSRNSCPNLCSRSRQSPVCFAVRQLRPLLAARATHKQPRRTSPSQRTLKLSHKMTHAEFSFGILPWCFLNEASLGRRGNDAPKFSYRQRSPSSASFPGRRTASPHPGSNSVVNTPALPYPPALHRPRPLRLNPPSP